MDEHEGQEFDYVISGSLLLYIGDICYELNEGDSAYFDSSIPHAHKNVGDTQAEFIANFGGYNIMAIATVRNVDENGLITNLTVRPK